MKKQIKVTLDEDLYNLISKKCMEELGEINLSLYTRILYNKEVKKTELSKYKRELKKINKNNKRLLLKDEMKELRSQGLTYGEIGEIYSMSRQAIHQKLKRK
tara:strand:+ start:716 stop:1021 length:306 start_codon:yes stop_codon:yes gene_type:complete